MFCHGFLPKNLTKNENEELLFSFTLCGEPAPRVTWSFNTNESDNEIIPIKLKDCAHIYTLKLPFVSVNMCGKDMFIVCKTSLEEVVSRLRIYVNCE